jgi:hypothetical protein
MNFKDKQEIFEYVVTFLNKQGEISEKDDCCAYRGSNNTKCAIGCILDDKYYDPLMEGLCLYDLIRKFKLPKFIKDNYEFLFELQDIHDYSGNWKVKNNKLQLKKYILKSFAKSYDLNLDFLED